MKKFLVALAMLAIFFTSSIASAAYEENIEDDADLTTIKTMAVAMPNYYRMEEAEPTLDELTKAIYAAGRDTSSHDIISYEDVAASVRRDTDSQREYRQIRRYLHDCDNRQQFRQTLAFLLRL